MGLKDRKKVKVKQKVKRHKKRLKMLAKGLDPNEFYFGQYYIGRKETISE